MSCVNVPTPGPYSTISFVFGQSICLRTSSTTKDELGRNQPILFGCFRKFRAKRSNWEGGLVRLPPFVEEASVLAAMFIIGSSSKGNGSWQLVQTTMLGSELPMAIFSHRRHPHPASGHPLPSDGRGTG